MPFLVPYDSVESEELILVLSFGTVSLLEAQCVFGDKVRISMPSEDIAVVSLNGRGLKGVTELVGVHKVAVPLPPIESGEFVDAIDFPEKNFNFSLSLYNPRGNPEEEYDELCEELVSTLREAGHKKANLIRSRGGPELYGERVVSRSAMDFVAFPLGSTYQWGVTVYVPETTSFKERSMERPFVTSSISLSSRLARLLVNVSGVSKGQVLLDPFCGSGTILAEAALKGVETIGIDRNHGTVDRAKENLKWLYSEDRGGKHPPFSVMVGDAMQLRKTLGERKVDAIVSEPILVPKLSSPPSEDKARKLIRHASRIYSEALYEMSAVLQRGGRMVLVTPALRSINGKDVTLTFEDIRDIGLRPLQPQGFAHDYPLALAHQSTRWVRRMIYVMERL